MRAIPNPLTGLSAFHIGLPFPHCLEPPLLQPLRIELEALKIALLYNQEAREGPERADQVQAFGRCRPGTNDRARSACAPQDSPTLTLRDPGTCKQPLRVLLEESNSNSTETSGEVRT